MCIVHHVRFKQQLRRAVLDCLRLRTATFWTWNMHLSLHNFPTITRKCSILISEQFFFGWAGADLVSLELFSELVFVNCVIAYIWKYICGSGQLGRWYHSWGFQLNSRRSSQSVREDNLSYMKSPTRSLKSAFSHTTYPQHKFKSCTIWLHVQTDTYTHICSFIMES